MTAKFEKVETNKVVLTFEISQEDIKKGLDQAFNRVKKERETYLVSVKVK